MKRMCCQLDQAHRMKLLYTAWFFFHFLLTLSQCVAMAVEVPFIPKQVLIFGGNGFIGSSTAERLIEAGHKLTLVSRGNWYWDSASTVMPFVQHIKCNRRETMEQCSELKHYVANIEQIDAVIDFSAYYAETIQESLDLVHRKTKLYIYISTDSVYEVCIKNHTGPTLETDAVRPESEEMRKNFESWDSYGHHKLECEEHLTNFSAGNSALPFIILRLPDVIGPRDNTNRWWYYQLWMKLKYYLEKDIIVPKSSENRLMSMVYVKDVADMIQKLVQNSYPNAYFQTFNLALKETFTLKQFLETMRDQLNATNVSITVEDSPLATRMYPSVKLGPVDTTKAEQILQWVPTKWADVLRETCDFYEMAIASHYFINQRSDMIRMLQNYLTTKPNNVYRALRNVYGLGYPETKDEL
ncbi:uncharacterized protein LOC106061480 [Biomphalaria glabrata]|uniref:Uncharacterized protein LOC106061480 n=1 Tax=Biomphalaria glabrata TaxID=6526 RepID=A0A9W3B4S5_BIOGL|nr:uncharacterized protein LOC106061480 [Biomphalaria glabrata]XP_055894478.1 uncharacterized protein LOC106061480 [Biomphalaria glabrata]XP_055894479.1 uncharacterized protein LOC106061480 [Biomphalaria glabrata]XP_055894480.1 uncharacterized protein LOC106061480 [Biomphalaria glabrata]KAI8757511.1 chloroplast stem-loop binding protein of 41 kDa b; chloroplastic [Biomphalaria glabrata]